MDRDSIITKTPQLRIAVNSRCQKACFFCRPAGEGSDQDPENQLTTLEIVSIVKHLASYGIRDIKLTGGDPILKDDIVQLVSLLKSIPEIRSVHLVTRHHRAGVMAKDLADAGLDCLNFSLDTLDPEKFHRISGVNSLNELLVAIKHSTQFDLAVKINTVVMKGINSDEIHDILEFSDKNGISVLKFLDLILDMEADGVSFAHRLDDIAPGQTFADLYYPLERIAEYLSGVAIHKDISHQPGGLGHPMMSFLLKSGMEVQVKDARRGAWYGDICNECPLYQCHDAIMALRLTSDGKLQRCLARADNLIDVLTPVKKNNRDEIDLAITKALYTYESANYCANPAMLAQRMYPLHEDTDSR